MSKKSEQLLESSSPVVLSANVLVDGKFISAGSETPFNLANLPEHLKPYIASGDEDFFHPSQRDIYHGQPGPEPGAGFVYQGVSNSQWVQRQARQVAGAAQFEDWAAEHANEPLPPETLAVLEDEHTHRIDKLKAQGAYAQRLTDAAYESAAQAVEPPQLFVKRGGEMGRIERSKLKPGEPCFAKFGDGGWQVVGYVDATGQAPEAPLVT